MKSTSDNKIPNFESQKVSDSESEVMSLDWAQATYHEMSDTPVVQMDALAQLHANISLIEEMQARLSFLMREVRYQMKF
jgi:hypothetical protein